MVDTIWYPTVSCLPFVQIITFMSFFFFMKLYSETPMYWRQMTWSQTWKTSEANGLSTSKEKSELKSLGEAP